MGIVIDTVKGFWNLIVGLFTTGKYLPRKSVTLQYPDERWPMPERSRGVVVLLSNPETGELNCNACQVCMKQCPVHAIDVEQVKDPETKKRYPGSFTIDNTICCFCGICEEVCNFDAIKLTGKYEFSVFDKKELIYNKEKLQELGRDVKYTPRKKPSAEKKESTEAKTDKIETKQAAEKTESKPEEDKS